MRKKSIAIILTLIILALALVSFVACNEKKQSAEFELPNGSKPDLRNRITAADRAIIEAGMADDADEDAKKLAVITLYDIANSSRIEDNLSLMVQESLMSITGNGTKADSKIGDGMATVVMHGFTLKSGGSWYNQFVANVDEANSNAGAFAGLMGTFGTNMLKINYHLDSEPDDYYFVQLKGDGIDPDCNYTRFPYATYRLIEKPAKLDYDTYIDKTHTLTAPNEIYNMNFMPEIIAADSVTIEHANGVYKVHFEFDPYANKADLEDWWRLPKADLAEGGQTLGKYLRYNCDLEVWDTGYAKSYYADYARTAGIGGGVTVDDFRYLWNENEIMDILLDDFRLDDMSTLEKTESFRDADDFLNYYIEQEVVKGKMGGFMIAVIVIASVLGAALIAFIIVVILLKAGKLPKLAEKLAANKQKRLEKKAAKKAAKNGETPQTLTEEPELKKAELTKVEEISDEQLVEIDGESEEQPSTEEQGEEAPIEEPAPAEEAPIEEATAEPEEPAETAEAPETEATAEPEEPNAEEEPAKEGEEEASPEE